jgi:hypothetical protein
MRTSKTSPGYAEVSENVLYFFVALSNYSIHSSPSLYLDLSIYLTPWHDRLETDCAKTLACRHGFGFLAVIDKIPQVSFLVLVLIPVLVLMA